MFDLNQAIAGWRQRMVAGGIQSSAVLDELESHLRDDIEAQVQNGINERRAFEEAAERLGVPTTLQAEFLRGSADAEEHQLRSRCLGLAAAGLVVAGAVFSLASLPLTLGERVRIGCLSAAIGAQLASIPWLLAAIAEPRLRKAMTLLWGIVLPLLWPAVIFGVVAGDGSTLALWATCVAVPLAIWAALSVSTETSSPFGMIPWTPSIGRSLEAARGEAARFHHDFIGTEHMLLGLLEAENGTVTQILKQRGITRETLREYIARLVGTGPVPSSTGERPARYTPRLGKALALAAKEARTRNRGDVTGEQILLGLMKEGSGVAAQVLKQFGVRPDAVRDAGNG